MRIAWLRGAIVCALALAIVGSGASRSRAGEPDEGGPSLTLAAGSVRVDGVVELNLSSDLVAKPVSLAPDVYYGATDELTVGLVHSAWGTTGIAGGVGNGLCPTGQDGGCVDIYNNVGLGAEYSFLEGELDVAADSGLYSDNLQDPALLSLKAGVLGRWRSGDLHVDVSPNVFLELAARDNNPDIVNIPVKALYAVAPLELGAQLGFRGELAALGDTWALPLSAIAQARVSDRVRVAAALSFPRLVAKTESADIRSLSLVVSYRL